ncbi:hypothetical protein [Streptomyces poriticola]|uniref:hypothetical protein n=1 Tax=Streptomyces poriticola TaxID=3120506 RepID=UPI002FCE0C4B
MKKLQRNLLLGAALLLTVGGAGHYALSATSEPAAEEPAVTAATELPLDAYRLSPDAEADYDHAGNLLIRTCMEDAGFTWYVPAEPAAGSVRNVRRYGVIELAVAQRYGYHAPPDERSEKVGRMRDRTMEDPDAAEAFLGPEGNGGKGCSAKAGQRLGRGAGPADYGLLAGLDWRSLDLSEKHPEVRATWRDWQTCMRSQGYRYTSPRSALADRKWSGDDSAVSDTERAVAVADVVCKSEVGLVETWTRVERRIQHELIAQHPELERLRQVNEVLDKNARAVLKELQFP